jgi:hypothetical protein
LLIIKNKYMYNKKLKIVSEGPQNPPVKPLSGKREVIEGPTNPPKSAKPKEEQSWWDRLFNNEKQKTPKPATPNQTNNPVELTKKRIEEFKKSLTADDLNKIDKILPIKDGGFQINYKDKSIRDVWPSGRFQRTSGTDGSKYMGTYNNDWEQTDDSAEQTYKKYKDKAWLSAEEEKELGIKKNPDTGKYEKIDQSNTTQAQNTGGSGTSGTSGSGTTTKKRGTPLNAQDYEGINFNYRYPGDKNWRYGVKNNEWYAKNITNNRVFNISKDGFTSSVNYLNAQFPDAFKEVAQQTTPPAVAQDTTTKTTTPPVTQQDTTTKTTTPPAVAQDSTSGSKYLIDKPFEI